MTANDLFEEVIRDPILKEKYNFTNKQLDEFSLHAESGEDVIEVIKLIVLGIENDIPKSSIYSQIRSHFKI